MGQLFGKKDKSKKIVFQVFSKFDRDASFKYLNDQGWEQIGNPFEFDRKGTTEKIRSLAMEYAQRIDADMLIEVEDEHFSTNPYNNQVFYAWKMSETLKASLSPTQAPPQPQPQLQYYSPTYKPITHQREKEATYAYTSKSDASQTVYTQPHPFYPQDAHEQRQSRSPPSSEVRSEAQLVLKSQYYNYEEALNDYVEKLAMLLMKEDKPFKFIDTKEFLHPKVTIKRGAYYHVGGRIMNLVLVQMGVNDFMLIGNETHRGTSAAGTTASRRDELISIKTLGRASFMPLSDLRELGVEQKSAIANALFSFLSQFLPVV